MNDVMVKFPAREVMLERLISVDDNDHLQERFYPILLKSAEREMYAAGVALWFALAVHDYVDGMPPMLAGILNMRAPAYFRALIDDPIALDEALKMLSK